MPLFSRKFLISRRILGIAPGKYWSSCMVSPGLWSATQQWTWKKKTEDKKNIDERLTCKLQFSTLFIFPAVFSSSKALLQSLHHTSPYDQDLLLSIPQYGHEDQNQTSGNGVGVGHIDIKMWTGERRLDRRHVYTLWSKHKWSHGVTSILKISKDINNCKSA